MATPRQNLKQYFKKHNRPTEVQFSELIDSVLHRDEDGLFMDGYGNLLLGRGSEPSPEVRGQLHLKQPAEDQRPGLFIENGLMAAPANKNLQWGHLDLSGNFSAGIQVTAEGNVGIGTSDPSEKLEIDGAILFISSDEDRTLIYHSTSKSGVPTEDGFRIRYSANYFAQEADALIIEKTDRNNNIPDGGIAFLNTGSDGIEREALTISGNGSIGIGGRKNGTKMYIDGYDENSLEDLTWLTWQKALTVRGAIKLDSFASDISWGIGNTGEGNLYFFRNNDTPGPNEDINYQMILLPSEMRVNNKVRTFAAGDHLFRITDTATQNSVTIGTDDNPSLNSFLRIRPMAGAGLAITNNGDTIGLFVDSGNGHVGIGKRSSNNFWLDVAGDIRATDFKTGSDIRLKTNIKPLQNVMKKLQEIKGVRFEWNEKFQTMGHSSKRTEIGLIAQDIEKEFPELISYWGEENYMTVSYGRMTAILLEAIKEVNQKLEKLEKKVFQTLEETIVK